VRRLYGVFSTMPPERRRLLSQEVQLLDEMDPEQRRERLASPEFREKYSADEQRWLTELSKALHEEE
jgi:hypothetical protein